MGHQDIDITSADLQALDKEFLSYLCFVFELQPSGTKRQLAERLLRDGLRLESLTKPDLKDILTEHFNVEAPETKYAMVTRVLECIKEDAALGNTVAVKPKPPPPPPLQATAKLSASFNSTSSLDDVSSPLSSSRNLMSSSLNRSNVDYFLRIGERAANANGTTGAERERVLEKKTDPDNLNARLKAITLEELQDWCRRRDVFVSTSKPAAIMGLIGNGVRLEDIVRLHLVRICDAEGLDSSGTRIEIVDRLRDAGDVTGINYEDQALHTMALMEEVNAQLASMGKDMSPEAYAEILLERDLMDEEDEIQHIISPSRGGADHLDNYMVCHKRTWKRSMGTPRDALNCFLVGMPRARKAVAVSKRIGNADGRRVSGETVEELHQLGLNAMRVELRLRNRRLWTELRYSRT